MSEQVNFWRHKAAAWTQSYGYNPYLDGSDADTSINRDLNEQKRIAEELYANHGIAKAIINNATNHTVLSGISFSVDTKDQKLNDDLERELQDWSTSRICDATRKNDLNMIFELLVRSLFLYGESISLIVGTNQGASLRGLPYSVIESPEQSDLIKNGIEVDKYGTPVRIFIKTADGKYSRKPFYDSEGNPIVLHTFQPHFFGQTHGLLPLTSCYNMLLDLSVFLKSELATASLSSQISIITKMNNPEIRGANLPSWRDQTNQDGTKVIRTPVMSLSPGKTINLQPGESIESFKLERPTNLFQPFCEYITKTICAAFGLSEQYLFSNWQESNFSSARVCAIQTQAVIKRIQQLVISTSIKPLVDAQIRYLLDNGVIKGDYKEIQRNTTVVPPQLPLLDPLKEVNASKQRLDAGLTTLQRECSALGTGDYLAIMHQQAREKQEREALNLLPTDNQPAPEVGRPPSEGSTKS